MLSPRRAPSLCRAPRRPHPAPRPSLLRASRLLPQPRLAPRPAARSFLLPACFPSAAFSPIHPLFASPTPILFILLHAGFSLVGPPPFSFFSPPLCFRRPKAHLPGAYGGTLSSPIPRDRPGIQSSPRGGDYVECAGTEDKEEPVGDTETPNQGSTWGDLCSGTRRQAGILVPRQKPAWENEESKTKEQRARKKAQGMEVGKS